MWVRGLAWLLGLGIPTWILLAPRTQNYANSSDAYTKVADVGALWTVVLKYLALGALSFGAVALLYFIFSKRALPRAGRNIWIGVLAFSSGPIVSSWLGAKPAFTYGLLYLPLFASIIFLFGNFSAHKMLPMLKAILRIFVFGSLVTAVMVPHWAFQLAYDGSLIPNYSLRLYGLAPHPNALGPLALLYLILEWIEPTKQLWWRFLSVVAALSVLVMAQSKTAIIIAIIIALLLIAVSILLAGRHGAGSLLVMVVSGMLAIGLTGALPAITANLSQQKVQGLSTLTGRTSVWAVTVDTWRKNPIFGYGPSIWDLEFRTKYGSKFLFAGQAHNQFFQSLGEAGIIGILGFSAYCIALVFFGIRYTRISRGGSLALVAFLLLRTVTEASFRNYVLDPTLLIHLFSIGALTSIAAPLETVKQGMGKPRYGQGRSHNHLPQSPR